MKPLTIPAVDLYDALSAVMPMVSKDDTRPHVHCVHVRSKSKRKTPKGEDGLLELFGTNGHCIARWKQRLEGATDREFNIESRCAKRMLAELRGVLKEHRRLVKHWEYTQRWKKKEEQKPKPKEPTLTFFEGTYQHLFGDMRLDLVDETYPKIDKIVNVSVGGSTALVGVASTYLAQAVACFQKAAHTKNPVPVIQEWEGKGGPMSMMRFRTEESLGGFGGTNRAFNLTVFVMPMRVE